MVLIDSMVKPAGMDTQICELIRQLDSAPQAAQEFCGKVFIGAARCKTSFERFCPVNTTACQQHRIGHGVDEIDQRQGLLPGRLPIDHADKSSFAQENVPHRQIIVCGNQRNRHTCESGTALCQPIPVLVALFDEG